jgi:hypothetical protein
MTRPAACSTTSGSFIECLTVLKRRISMPITVTNRKTEETAIDVVNVVVGVCLALMPWLAGFTHDAPAATNAWLVGAAIALIAIGALVSFKEWEEWLNLALGVWVSPRTGRQCMPTSSRAPSLPSWRRRSCGWFARAHPRPEPPPATDRTRASGQTGRPALRRPASWRLRSTSRL